MLLRSRSVHNFQVLENATITQNARKRKGSISSDVEISLSKHKKENIFDLGATDDLTSLSPLNEDTGLILPAPLQHSLCCSC